MAQTIQKTAKKWKFLMLLGLIGMFVGGTMLVMDWGKEELPGIGVLLRSFDVLMLATLGAWWFHE